MNKTNHAILTERFNKTAPAGHQVIKIHTRSHSNFVTHISCSCGKFHDVNNDHSMVYWPNNTQEIPKKKEVDPNGIHGPNYNNF